MLDAIIEMLILGSTIYTPAGRRYESQAITLQPVASQRIQSTSYTQTNYASPLLHHVRSFHLLSSRCARRT